MFKAVPRASGDDPGMTEIGYAARAAVPRASGDDPPLLKRL